MDRGYQDSLTEKLLSEINKIHTETGNLRFWNKTARKKKKFCLSWNNTSPYGVHYKRKSWILIQNQPLLC